MSLKYSAVLIFIVVGVAVSSSTGNDPNHNKVYRDLPCLSFGGLCVLSTECPKGKQVPVKGLCPLQKDGVECCYSLPISETRCEKQGGHCIDKKTQRCPENLTFSRATDCGVDELCCILV